MWELNTTLPSYERALDALVSADRVITLGVGKSKIVADLTASLLRSVLVPAVSVHATDFHHGDANYLPEDRSSKTSVTIVFSHSGKTEEVVRAARTAAERGSLVVAVTSDESDVIGKIATAWLKYKLLDGDGSKHGTIPTQSVMAQLSYVNTLVCSIADTRSAAQLHGGHKEGSLGYTYERKTHD